MTLDFTREAIRAPRNLVFSAAIPIAPIDPVNALTQVRRTMKEDAVDELAFSILSQGQHTPGVAVFLEPDEAKRYVRELNELWGTNHRLSSLVKITLEGTSGYLALIAGHRRKRAVTRAVEMQTEGEEAGDKFTGRYLCDIYFALTVEEAITIQFHENRHQQVPLQEEVDAALCTWRFMRKRHPQLTKRDFGKVVGRGVDWVSRMLRFSNLPQSVQDLIVPNSEGARVSYQLLCEVARLIEAEEKARDKAESDNRPVLVRQWTEEATLSFVNHLIARRVNPKDFAKEVSKRIAELESGQGDLLFGGEEEVSLRKVAVPELVRAVHANLGYWQGIEQIRRRGGFEVEGSPFAPVGKSEFSPQSPIRLALKSLETLHEIMPHLAEMALREGRYRRKLERAAHRAGIDMVVFQTLAEAA